jgi:hypothetical protein
MEVSVMYAPRFGRVLMRVWLIVCTALVIGCSFDSTPRVRNSAPAAMSDRNVVGLYSDGATPSDAASAADASGSADASDAADAQMEPGLQSDAGALPMHDSAVKVQDPSQTPDTKDPPNVTMSTDASMPGLGDTELSRDAAAPPPAAGSGGSVSPAPNPTLQLLKAAQFSGDERAITALLAAVVAQAKTGADLERVLATLDGDGQCAFIQRVTCLMACGVIATRCSLCTSDPGCAAEMRRVCGVGAPNCL